eukprot:2132224-Pleurochrysis_carterae.AAC.1
MLLVKAMRACRNAANYLGGHAPQAAEMKPPSAPRCPRRQPDETLNSAYDETRPSASNKRTPAHPHTCTCTQERTGTPAHTGTMTRKCTTTRKRQHIRTHAQAKGGERCARASTQARAMKDRGPLAQTRAHACAHRRGEGKAMGRGSKSEGVGEDRREAQD